MQPVYFLVSAVEGRQVVVYSTIGTPSLRRVGHKRVEEGVVTKAGRVEPRVRFVFDNDAEPELVQETRDRYYARAVERGDIDYVGTISSPGAKDEKKTRDPALVRVTSQNKTKRATEALKFKSKDKADADALELELRAADEGLTVEEFKAKSTPKSTAKQ
jgi:hypothetical protein